MLDLGVITASLSPAAGGLFESVRLPAIKLAQRGARVTVHGMWDHQFEANQGAWHGVGVEISHTCGPRRLRVAPELLHKIMAADHDLLHLHGIWLYPSYVTDHWRRARLRPTVISPRGMLDPWAISNSALKKHVIGLLYENRNLAGAAAIHALNEGEARAIRLFGLKNPIAVIPNGIDPPDPTTATAAVPPFMMGDHRRVLLFLGRLHAKKGLGELIEAWSQVLSRVPAIGEEWRVVIAGWDDGGYEKKLTPAIMNAGLDHHVTIAGPVWGAAKAQALRHASAFILPSRSEGMPMAVLEAWAYRLPVFMTPECNLPQGIAAGAGIEIETDPDKMASVLAASLDQSQLLNRAREAGYAFVMQNYTWDRVVADMERLYAWVTRRGPRPDFVV